MKKKSMPGVFGSAIVIIFAVSHFILITTDGFSRAGRGQSYRSSSSSHSSSSRSYSGGSGRGSSSGSSHTYIPPYGSINNGTGGSGTSGTGSSTASDDNGWIIGLIFMLAVFGIGVFIIYKIVKAVKKSIFGAGAGPAIPFDDTAPLQYEFNPVVLENIRKDDAEFDPGRFMEKAKTVSERLQQAWSGGDMMPVRNYVSQGVFNRFRLQLELMAQDEGVKNIMSDFKVMKVSVLALSTSKSYHTLHASLFACAKDVTVPAGAADGEIQKALQGTRKEAFYEVYSLTRKLGVKTNTSRDWLKGECPHCGYVPDNFSENNKCRSCGSIYNSGEFDWVLSEITQQEEWKDESAREIEGLSGLEGKNLSINREVIEDRASYLFWRWVSARVKGSAAPLSRDAVPGFLQGFGQAKSPLYDIAVGAVDLESVKTDGDDAVAAVKILWSAASRKNDEPYHLEHRFFMKMPLAMKNPYGLADHSCDSCGAPLPESDSLKCSYCASDIPAVVNDWLLVSVEEIQWELK